MADIAYERLAAALEAFPTNDPPVRDTAALMLDAWSIIDSAHRFKSLLAQLPGLQNSPWRRTFEEKTDTVTALRNAVQHQLDEIPNLMLSGGQVWGYLSWRETIKDELTGNWRMTAAGSVFVGDQFLYIGPATLPYSVPANRLRLNAFNQQVYLGRVLHAIADAVAEITRAIADGEIRARGAPAAERRGADFAADGSIEIVIANSARARGEDPDG